MNSEKHQRVKDIHQRIYKYVVDVLQFLKQVPRTPENSIILYQVTKSVTSIIYNTKKNNYNKSHPAGK